MVLNADKCQSVMCLGKDTENPKCSFMGIFTLIIKKRILDIIIDNAILFDSHIKEVYKIASLKQAALSYLVDSRVFYMAGLGPYTCSIAPTYLLFLDFQKQPPRGVPRKRCSENMQQIYRRTPMPKRNFNKVALQLY